MARFLLLHGAWHGGWCWSAVAERLSRAGHSVSAPDLPGLGADAGNLTPDIGLETHLAFALTELDRLGGAILCGHSYGGMPARGLVDRRPDLIEGLMLIEALWPGDGEAAFDLVPKAFQDLFRGRAEAEGEGWRMPPPDVAQFAIADAALAADIAARLTDHPLKTFEDPLRLSGPARLPGPRSFVIAADRDPQPYAATAAALSQQGWTIKHHPGGHEMMMTQPGLVAEALLEVAADSMSDTERKTDAQRA
ncbi:alpha/beta hydrolase [Pelagibius litoralis]|uniref:Alpha/beta hydrolase n=1 Tax=Pelagibius litoralis TaxID=374515 RepID=A0A967KB28_9PROT|nr:alpha/beta hydrolase [Pelagibius litoralis]NIA70827.1 alpha/beta hydrolase [Pelagibius litoralis]